MKIITVLGARPQFIKASIVSKALAKLENTQEFIIHTGQHYDNNLSDDFFNELNIPRPKYNLEVGSGNHGLQTGRMLEKLEAVILNSKPDLVIVYGDTNSTLAGALAAVKLNIPLAHVEAGLRSFNRKMPEEINRLLTDHCSDLLFTPTKGASDNLIREGISPNKLYFVGDVMYDAALYYSKNITRESSLQTKYALNKEAFILATIHRAENTDDKKRLTYIVQGLSLVAKEIPVIMPLHPRTKTILEHINLYESFRKMITVIEPTGYLEMMWLEQNAVLIVTDSGGVQKEAFFHKKPCVTLREETEWTELVDAGWNSICPPNSKEDIYDCIMSGIGKKGQSIALYGDGDAASKIVSIINSSVKD